MYLNKNSVLFGRFFAAVLLGSLSSCSALDTTITDPVEWWAVNGWNSAVTIEVYDLNCNRMLRDLNFRSDEDLRVVSCGDGNGMANIRYRREGYASRSTPWSDNESVRPNQTMIVR